MSVGAIVGSGIAQRTVMSTNPEPVALPSLAMQVTRFWPTGRKRMAVGFEVSGSPDWR